MSCIYKCPDPRTFPSPNNALKSQRVDSGVFIPVCGPRIPKPRGFLLYPRVSTISPQWVSCGVEFSENITQVVEHRQQKTRRRRLSEQDTKTRSVRASLVDCYRNNDRITSSSANLPSFDDLFLAPPLLPWTTTEMMEVSPVPRPLRPARSSTVSSVVSRSSFESRSKSPLSMISSADDNYTWSSNDSWYQNSNKPQFLTPDVPMLYKNPSMESIVERYRADEGKLRASLPKIGSGPPRQRVKKVPIRILGQGFEKLPKEILHVVLAELKKIHLGPGSTSCATCWMRDLANLGLSCRKWWQAVKIGLYEDIQLIGCDSPVHSKRKLRAKHGGTRLTLLRRTLRSQPLLASYVKTLKVPAMPETAKKSGERTEYLDLVASLVMACPNLERLPGFHQKYNHEYSRLLHALSTRTQFTEMVWLINPSPYQRQHRYQFSQENADYFAPTLEPSPLLPEQCHNFLAYHDNWSNLSTLWLHCNRGGTLDAALFPNLLWSLPNLDNLHVSSFPANSFNDSTLLSFPSLKKLRLENLPGVTAAGLAAYPSPRRTDKMTSLSLISIPLLSLATLARIFAHLKSLVRFTISQAPALAIPHGSAIFLHPYLASLTLKYLHWEFTNPDNDKYTDIMAKAILHGGFPALRIIRSPSDHEGVLQKLCRPKRQIELPSDRFSDTAAPPHPGLPHTQSTSAVPSPTRSTFPVDQIPPIRPAFPSIASSPTRSKFPSISSPSKSKFSITSSPTKSSFPSMPSPTGSTFALPSPTRSTFSLGHAYSFSSSSAAKSPSRSVLSLPLSSSNSDSSKSSSPEREKGISLSLARKMAQARIDTSLKAPKFHIIIWGSEGEFVERFAVGGFMGTVGRESKINYILQPDIEGSDEAIVSMDGKYGLLDVGEEAVKEGMGCTGYWNADVGNQGRRMRERWWHCERGRWREVGLKKFF